MGCTGCSTKDGIPSGCGSKGSCGTGGCNKLNTFDWLSSQEIRDVDGFDIVEISFKNGARKEFCKNLLINKAITGEMVVVDTGSGYDMGQVSLSGELVRLQMKKKKVRIDNNFSTIIRIANDRDLERLEEARKKEKSVMVRARVIARNLGLEMKLGDVEFRADKRKATFYYTAEGRVDFRELVRTYAGEFRIKVEMRQIGSRQESARLGGIGTCGRELCCSTWLTDFKSVSTSAARYQNMSINQAKLSGQCGRLKCCLNYELDTYMDALEAFPDKADTLHTANGRANLIKLDIFKGLMYYMIQPERGRNIVVPLELEAVHTILKMNKNGEKPQDLSSYKYVVEADQVDLGFEDVTGVIELPAEKKKKKGNRRWSKGRSKGKRSGGANQANRGPKSRKSNNGPNQKRSDKSTGPSAKKRGNRRGPSQNRNSRPGNSNNKK